MDDGQIALVQESFAKLRPMRDKAARLFYANLFATAPEVRPYFSGVDMAAQGRKLIDTLAIVVNALHTPERIIPAVEALALRHVGYGVKPQDYAKVGASLIRTLEQGLGDAFDAQTRAAWAEAFDMLSAMMISAAYGESGGAGQGPGRSAH